MRIRGISPLSLFSIVFFLLMWYVVSLYFPPSLLASPEAVIYRFYDLATRGFAKLTLFQHIGVSLTRVLMGFALAAVTGVPLGLLMGWYKKVEQIVDPIFEIFRPIPPIAWIPLAILWFGIGEISKIYVIFIGGFVACVINSYAAIKTTPEILIRAARSLGASDRDILLEVAIPHSIPYIFSAFRIALGAGWMTLVAAEMIASSSGLGFLILMGREWILSDLIIAGMLTIGIIGYLMDFVLRKIEERICPWRGKVQH
ncbi:MAG: ABC transporter permease [Candidatus Baldrarchaeia archaeon]